VLQQFYQVILNKRSLRAGGISSLLESQFERPAESLRGRDCPRFNVLQAEVALANQQPVLMLRERLSYRSYPGKTLLGLSIAARGDHPWNAKRTHL